MNYFSSLFYLVCVQGLGHPKVQGSPTNSLIFSRKVLKVKPADPRSGHSFKVPFGTNSSNPAMEIDSSKIHFTNANFNVLNGVIIISYCILNIFYI